MEQNSDVKNMFFCGSQLKVSAKFHTILLGAFPWLNLIEQYRIMDCWLEANPRKRWRNQPRGVVNWLNRQPKPSLKEIQTASEIHVGRGPELTESERLQVQERVSQRKGM
jgi:hypothetical protein